MEKAMKQRKIQDNALKAQLRTPIHCFGYINGVMEWKNATSAIR